MWITSSIDVRRDVPAVQVEYQSARAVEQIEQGRTTRSLLAPVSTPSKYTKAVSCTTDSLPLRAPLTAAWRKTM
jgi:hypothetical protein